MLRPRLLLHLQLLQLLLQCCYLRVNIRLFCNQPLKVYAVKLRQLRQSSGRVAGQLFCIRKQLGKALTGVHTLKLPILLIWTNHLMNRVKALAVIRKLLLFLRGVALRFLPLLQPSFRHCALFRRLGNLAKMLFVLFAPYARSLKRGKLCRNRRGV